ncbi:VOC family protein [Novosphingobium album (ex Hu et al. 2023)]|uniref:VOC family protein n=1 Tax=Novosphingobium album (ex Hu et al. 2023) TaxID=2930093 RepID=A0ABT0B7L3_9SPHN|nr:VOC family protein [Novosphingobium album (ex Hu et al. 2023)]MCJ2180856.1 VOC family protein [Novosphingobium album (ex Hu et al. 2023)]
MRIAGDNIGSCPCIMCMSARRRRLVPAVRGPMGAGAGAAVSPRYQGSRSDGSGFPPVHHIGMVVRDRDKALANLSGTMGFGPAFPFEGIFPDALLANGERGLSLKGAFVWMRNTAVEIVEPMDDRSPHYEFLQERGEGLHHLAYWVDSVRGEIAKMRAGGVDPKILVDGTGPGNDVPWCYLEGEMAGSALVELIERNEGSEQFYEAVFEAIGGKIPV